MLEGGADIRYVAENARPCPSRNDPALHPGEHRSAPGRPASCHPAAGLGVAMASELCTALPGARSAMAIRKTPAAVPTGA